MANIEVALLETEKQLTSMIESSGKTVPKPGERANIVEHLDYMIELLGTMVSDETFKAAKKKMANGYNAINDRVEIINWLLASGEISGDVDLEPLTVSENGEYMPSAGKGYSRVVVETPEVIDNSREIIEGTLTSIENSEVTSIKNNLFSQNSSLTTASFPMCTSIGAYAFGSCVSLTTVSFPMCTSIGYSAFHGCVSLTTVSFPMCTSIGDSAFSGCRSLTTVSFPMCTSIGNGAFSNCSSLTALSFPMCTSIGYSAFMNCHSLISLYLLGSTVCTLGTNAFYNTPMIYSSYNNKQYGSIFVPPSLVYAYQNDSKWSHLSSRITAYVKP